MLNKNEILKNCVLNLEKQVAELTAAAKASAALATDAEHRAKSKYETFSLETSYLARGQAMRVEEMRDALSRLRSFKPQAVPAGGRVQIGALVCFEDEAKEKQWVLLVPAGGGEEVKLDGQVIQLVTFQSPIAQVLLKKRVGDTFVFAKRKLRVVEVL